MFRNYVVVIQVLNISLTHYMYNHSFDNQILSNNLVVILT